MAPVLTAYQRAYLAANHDAARIYRYLRRFHAGVANALAREAAPRRFGLSDRRVRDLVSELGTQAFPITFDPQGGLFYAADAAELTPSCEILEARAKSEGARARGLRQAQGNLQAAEEFGRAMVGIAFKKPVPEGQQLLGAAR